MRLDRHSGGTGRGRGRSSRLLNIASDKTETSGTLQEKEYGRLSRVFASSNPSRSRYSVLLRARTGLGSWGL